MSLTANDFVTHIYIGTFNKKVKNISDILLSLIDENKKYLEIPFNNPAQT